MSTVWTFATDQKTFLVVTWFAGQERGSAVDFGARHTRAFEVVEAARSVGSAMFALSEDGDVLNGNEFVEMLESRSEWTHGEFGGSLTGAQAVEWEVG